MFMGGVRIVALNHKLLFKHLIITIIVSSFLFIYYVKDCL